MAEPDKLIFQLAAVWLAAGCVLGAATLAMNIRIFSAINARLRVSGKSLSWLAYANSWKPDPELRRLVEAEYRKAYRLKFQTLGAVLILAALGLILCLSVDFVK